MTEVLGPRRRALVALSAALATRDASAIRQAMRRVLDAGTDALAAEEMLLQSHLFLGFPDALNALGLWRETSGLPAPAPSDEDPAGWEARGQRVCATVYGSSYEKLRRNVGALHPDVDGWMATGGYGRVIGRPGLDLPTRELCIAALLAVWNVPRQLHSHLRGALNAGALPAEVDEAVEVACSLLSEERASDVRALWGEIRPRAQSPE